MKEHIYNIIRCILLLPVVAIIVSCSSFEKDAARFQQTLISEQERALSVTRKLETLLHGSSMDSLLLVTRDAQGIYFYVFDAHKMVFWSDNHLAASHVYLNRYDRWELVHFDNAWCTSRWSRAEEYNILTVVPIKNDYSIENEYLRNEFVRPFKLGKDVKLLRRRTNEGITVKDSDGNYLFSLYKDDGNARADETESQETIHRHRAENKGSFSYQSILTPADEQTKHGSRQIYFYIIFATLFLTVLLVVGVYKLFKSRGIRNMSLGLKFQYLTVLLLLVAFGYIFFMALHYVDSRFEERQSQTLLKKAGYIQKSLQNIAMWTVDIADLGSEVSVDLRDLCFAYETDIQVYDMSGNLVGTSSPAIFDEGIISRHISPEPFFTGDIHVVRQDHIGTMPYLTTYIEFYNSNYFQLGYIEVPFYITEDERRHALDDFLARLFPPFFAMVVLVVVLGLVFSRQLTRPLQSLTEGISTFRIGKANAHLQYDGEDEIGALVREYNRMVDELSVSTERLARSEREGAWRTMARQIAHEINNPLTPMKLNIQQLQRLKHSGDPRFEAFFENSTKMLIEQIDTLSHIASSFSSFAKMPEVHADKTDVAAALYSVITLFRSNQQRVPLRYVGADHGVFAVADGEQLPQVFTNLLKNALQALEEQEDGDIIVIMKDMANEVEITVSDNGPGIAEEVREKVFVPNFTTKSTGTGLGLAISKNIVEGAGGTIRFETSDKGTSFFVTLKK
ncbi:MAG: HAMP domain-containing histidine kinase [Paludibacteraceae bacterium]|nr:HAMP domain-containing histidine kinase [Paludibacteraceae bacterium]